MTELNRYVLQRKKNGGLGRVSVEQLRTRPRSTPADSPCDYFHCGDADVMRTVDLTEAQNNEVGQMYHWGHP